MINGSQNPIVGTDEIYTLVNYSLGLAYLDTNPKYTWYIKRLYGKKWIDITKEPQKTGLSVPFNFGPHVVGEKFLLEVYKETKNIFTQKNETHKMGELQVIPASGKVPKITKVVLFNRGAKDVNKASYTDKLVARAYCVGMFNKTINFHLWEDDAPGGGHHAEINKNNRINKAYPARVNVNGIAEAEISLSADQNVMKQVANRFMMRGDTNEGAFHEFYVTASYDHKILGASQTNVDVANPDYKQQQPKSSTPQKTNIPQPKQPQQEESLIARSINFIVDNVMNTFTPEKTKTATSVGENQQKENNNDNGRCNRCKKITLEELQQVFNNITDKNRLVKALPVFEKALVSFGIDTCLKKAHFFAQVLQEVTSKWTESGGESMDYSTERLVKGCYTKGNANDWIKGNISTNTGGYYTTGSNFKTSPFNKKRIPDYIAKKYGRKDLYKYSDGGVQKADQKMLAIWAYASKRDKNGVPLDEDGYWFRGKGLMQITWKENYEHAQEIINKKYVGKKTYSETDIDIVKYVQKFVVNKNDTKFAQTQEEADEYSIVSACGDWAHKDKVRNIGKVAQNGSSDKDVDNVTAIINLKTDKDSYAGRRTHFHRTQQIFKISQCKLQDEQNKVSKTSSGKVNIRLTRKWQNSKTTIGTFTIDESEITGYFLEEKGPSSTQANAELRIPTGTYKLAYHSGTKIKKGIHVWNDAVPWDRYILIHTGNTATDTEGCIIAGTAKVDDNTVSGSKDKFNEIYNFLKTQNIEDVMLIITEQF